jgi:tetratricopeptide (TPR) repeat protein
MPRSRLLPALIPLLLFGCDEAPEPAADGVLDLTGGDEAAAATTDRGERYAEVIEGPLNLRAAPDLDAEILRQLPAGARVEIIDEGPLDEFDGMPAPWYEVRSAAGEHGFVFGSFLELDVAEPANGHPAPPRTMELPAPDPALTDGMGAAALLDAAEEARNAGRADEAVEYLLAALRQRPENTDGYFDLAELYAELERWECAACALENYIAQAPDSFWGHNNLGLFCLRSGDYARAVAVLERAVTLEPEGRSGAARDEALALAHRNLIAAYRANGDAEGARRAQRRLDELL